MRAVLFRARCTDARRSAGVEPQRRRRRQVEQAGTHIDGRRPSALVPDLVGQAVARVEQLTEPDSAEARDRDERGRLHLDDDAPLLDPASDARTRFAENASVVQVRPVR
jgi:hypothetical protein